jgi:hypothetical protein
MIGAVPLLLASALGAGGSLDVGVRGEGTFRWDDPALTAGEARNLDATVAPHAGLRLYAGGASAELDYRPRLTLRDIGPDRRRETFHEGEVRLRLEPSAVFRLEAFGAGGVGQTDLVTLNRLAPPGQGTDTIPTTSTLDLRSLRAGATLRLAPDRRSEWILSATGSAGGGADAASRAFLPTERTASGDLQVSWSATRVDRLGLHLTAEGSRLPDLDGESAWSTALGTWRHRASRQVELSAGAGATGFYTSYPGTPGRVVSRAVRPAAELGLGATGGEHAAALSLGARLGASIDRVTGEASQSAEGTALLGWPATTWLALRLNGSGSVSWPRAGVIRRAGLEAGAAITVAPHLRLDLGGYGTWQRSANPIAPTLTEYGALLGVSISAPTLEW